MKAELCKKALEKVGNPNILVNIVSRRVRQLSQPGSRPLIDVPPNVGLADIVLNEIIYDKITWEAQKPEPPKERPVVQQPAKRRKKSV